jgi:hypothetical protein
MISVGRWVAFVLFGFAIGACAADEEAAPGNEDLAVLGTYSLEHDAAGDIALLTFVDDTHYALWKNEPRCVVSEANADIAACGEAGRYEIRGKELVLVDARTGASRTMPFERSQPSELVTTVAPKGLTDGQGGSLLDRTERLVARSIQVAGEKLRLVEREVDLLTTCDDRQEGSGAIPGAPNPGSLASNGVFASGPYAPGGQYDTRSAAAGTLFQTAGGSSHSYALISPRLPAGTTWTEANDALQRFNGPTGPAMRGRGDDPNSDRGWVVDPVLGRIPVGCVTFERGDGWARNTTQANHPFIGTITRWVVDGGDCTYRILTVGEGQGSGGVDNSGVVGETITGARHIGNVLGGPLIFRELDNQLLNYVRPSNAGGGCR